MGSAASTVARVGLATATGGLSEAANAGKNALPQPDAPNPTTPAATVQSADKVTDTGFAFRMSQQLAASAGNTLFSTPTQWMGQSIGNDPNVPRKTLVGA
jgi:hypothetical protein